MFYRLLAVPRLALAAGMAALIAIAPGWSSSTWASAPTAHTYYHAALPAKHDPLSGEVVGELQRHVQWHVQVDVAAVGTEPHRHDQDLWIR